MEEDKNTSPDTINVNYNDMGQRILRGLIKAGKVARELENAPKITPDHEIYYKNAFQELRGRWSPDHD